jgi:hypothetical protein
VQAPLRTTTSAAPRQQATTGVEPLAQFHRPIVFPDKPEADTRDVLVQRVLTAAETTDRKSPEPSARGTSFATPAVQRSEARIVLPEADAVSSMAGQSPASGAASSIPVIGIFILGAVLLLVCGWFGAVFLRNRVSRR